ncbi:hypothetical protein CPB83DRAFT_842189 [Crepidotus variabilis]|uniref:Inositol-1-monophosphatase n=1 Tax=Crepidotus variabilis TaxID=179855 RepID=A0A9P6ET48_9AGAR|nr:hypothetical protein CPB83DRAFT_842189 [Crepidotus variabilis]
MSTPELTARDLQEILSFTVALAYRAGELIIEGSEVIIQAPPDSESGVLEKKNAVDLVTEYDVRVEELVKKELGSKYPTFGFVGEESYSAGSRPPLTDAPTFCVDPIDGTTNFVHGLPYCCISLGLIYKRRPVLGVVFNPFTGQLFTGAKGQGSFVQQGKNSQPRRLPFAQRPRGLASLSQANIAVEWGSDRSAETMLLKTRSMTRLAGDISAGGKMAHAIKSLGSAALNFCNVAQGGLDIYWEIGCWPWDVCAGIVISQEAGCVITGSHDTFAISSSSPEFGDVTEEILTGRKYIVVRAIGDTNHEKGSEAQKRIIKEFYDAVEDFEP